VLKQLKAHDRGPGTATIYLNKIESLELRIERGVFGSDIMSSGFHLARFLYRFRKFYCGKDVADIGCGPGTQGIVMAKYGALSASLSDISPKAVENARRNVEYHKLSNIDVRQGDLFTTFPSNRKYDFIIFNHPYFCGDAEEFTGDPNEDVMLRKSMLGGTDLIKQFFHQVPQYLREDGLIIMSYFHFAGPENDPASHVEKYGLEIVKEVKVQSTKGLQRGEFSMYLIAVEGWLPK